MFVSGCGPGNVFGPTITPSPTITPTSTPTKTPTPTATSTPTSTPTPMGGASGLIVFQRDELVGSNNNKVSNLFLFDINAKTEIKLTNNQDVTISYWFPAISPNGKKVVFCKITNQTKGELFVIDIDGTNVQKISPAPMFKGNIDVSETLIDFHPSWSPDGTKIVFASNRNFLGSYTTYFDIFSIDLSTYEISSLTKGYYDSSHPWFSPDGNKITFMSNREGNWNIYTMDIDGKNIIKITSGRATNRFPKWSNDGKSIVFHSDRDGNTELYIYDIADETTTRITTDPSGNESASFSPDSNWVVYQSDTSGNYDLFIKNLLTGDVQKLTDSTFDETLADWAR
jgi:Tol biopolymer transport system component